MFKMLKIWESIQKKFILLGVMALIMVFAAFGSNTYAADTKSLEIVDISASNGYIEIIINEPVRDGEFIMVREENPDTGNAVGYTDGEATDRVLVPISRLSLEQVYYLQTIRTGGPGIVIDTIELVDEEFFNIIREQATVEVNEFHSQMDQISGTSRAGQQIDVYMTVFLGQDVLIGSTVVGEDDKFVIPLDSTIPGNRAMTIVATGMYGDTTTHTFLVSQYRKGENLIENGSFTDGLQGWITFEHLQNVSYGDGYANFQAAIPGNALGAVQTMTTESGVTYNLTLDVRVNELNPNVSAHEIYLGAVTPGGALLFPTRTVSISEEQLGEWVTLEFSFVGNSNTFPMGFTTYGLVNMDVTNISLTEEVNEAIGS